MAAELMTGISLFKSMLDTAKGLKDINDSTVRNTVSIELQEKILSAQEAQSALVERVRELKAQVAGFEIWEAEKSRYQLTEIPPGGFVYSLKTGMERGEPPHKLCANCFQNGKKSILQFQKKNPYSQDVYRCPACGTEFSFGQRQVISPVRVTRR